MTVHTTWGQTSLILVTSRPSTSPRLDGALGGRAELAAGICRSGKVQSKWQREMGDVQRKPGAGFQESPPVSHRRRLGTTRVTCPLGKLTGNSLARDFSGHCSQRHLLVGTWPNSRLTAGRQAFLQKPRCLYNSSGMGNYSAIRAMGTLPKSQFPDASPGLSLHVGLAQEGSLRPAVLITSVH